MGQHQSNQTVDVSTEVAANIMQTTAQNCINVGYGQNNIVINGNYNDVSGVSQLVDISINSKCATFATQNSTFNTDLSNAIQQVLSDQESTLFSWMDNSVDNQLTYITQEITSNFTQSAVQNCVNTLTGINNLYVSGDGNVIKDIVQNSTLNMLSQCILQNSQTSNVVSTITNTVNQHSTHTTQSIFSFIADAIEAIAGSIAVVAVVVFIVVISFVFLYLLTQHHAPPKVTVTK